MLEQSALRLQIRDALGAVEQAHRAHLAEEIRSLFADSLNLDAALQSTYPGDHRWDYLLGHEPEDCVVGVEVHSAETSEVTKVIAKREAARVHLRGHLREQARVASWIWVASGRTRFLPYDRAMRRLDQAGIRFVGGQVQPRHLQGLISTTSSAKR